MTSLYDLMRKCHDHEASVEFYYDSGRSAYALSVCKAKSVSSAVTLYFPKEKIESVTESDLDFLVEVLLDTVKINNTPVNIFNI